MSLCSFCQNINFPRSKRTGPNGSLQCSMTHQPSLAALQSSADNGCRVCFLIDQNLQTIDESSGDETPVEEAEDVNSSVILRRSRHSSSHHGKGENSWISESHIVVECGRRYGQLKLKQPLPGICTRRQGKCSNIKLT